MHSLPKTDLANNEGQLSISTHVVDKPGFSSNNLICHFVKWDHSPVCEWAGSCISRVPGLGPAQGTIFEQVYRTTQPLCSSCKISAEPEAFHIPLISGCLSRAESLGHLGLVLSLATACTLCHLVHVLFSKVPIIHNLTNAEYANSSSTQKT